MTDPARLLAVRTDFAWAQFEPLRDALVALGETWTRESVPERQPDGRTYLYKARVGEASPELRVQLGALVHQLSATLDNLAWAFAVRVKRAPGKVSFPITRSRTQFAATEWVRLLGLTAPCVRVAELFQPYYRPQGRCLLALHDLWNLDKHRAPAILPVIPTRATFIRQADHPKPLITKTYFPRCGQPVKYDHVLAKVVMASESDEPPIGFVALKPALDCRHSATRERILPQALYEMYRYVRHEVVPPLAALL